MTTPKTIIVSNRLPVTIKKLEDGSLKSLHSAGGLVSGLEHFHQSSDSLWVGHPGIYSNEPGFYQLKQDLMKDRLIPVSIRKKTYTGYYSGMSNDAIWPLFHYFPSAMKLKREDWKSYIRANEIFAEKILSVANDGDYIWVQDYQLMLLPGLIRKANPKLYVAYFHHIPFPSSEVFRIFPFRDELLEGLLGSDLIGFHTYDYVRHFLTTTTRVMGLDSHVDEVFYDSRFVRVSAFPLGVDVDMIQRSGEELETKEVFQRLKRDLGEKIVFLGIDRLDYTKGIPERLEAFQEFLETHPEYVGKVILIQICVPSREEITTYGNLRATVERLVSKINGTFGKPGYIPIQYIYRGFSKDEIISLYKLSDVAVVTPVRDGLNLVCKEYVAARTDETGVLILSEFAGSAAEMGEAIIVNPKNIYQVAAAMHQAVTMRINEQQERMHALRGRILKYNGLVWAESFIKEWHQHTRKNHQRSRLLDKPMQQEIAATMHQAQRFFAFFDYDGTLTPIVERPELAVPSQRLLTLLKRLLDETQGFFTIVTGRSKDFCDRYFTGLPINIVAEHGTYYWSPTEKSWESQAIREEFLEIKPDITKLLDHYTRCLPGSFIEEKDLSVVWHYRLAEQIFAKTQSTELCEALHQLLGKTSYSVFQGKKNLDVRHVLANKGRAVEAILQRNHHQADEPILTTGDDRTDEDMHRVMPESNISIHIGKPNIYSKFYLKDSEDLVAMLEKWLDNDQ